jgi:predicted ATPase
MLQSIRIKNYKVLKDIELKLSNFILISGLNNMGKSSLIQVLLLLRQSFEQKVLTSKGLLLNGSYTNIGNGKDALSTDAEDEQFCFDLEWENDEFLKIIFNYRNKSNLQPLKKIMPKDFTFSQALFSNRFKYLSAERTGPKSTYPVSEYAIGDLNSLGNNGEYTAHFLFANGPKALSNKNLRHEKAKSNTMLAHVDAWMSEITPGIKITPNVIEDVNQASIHYEFETNIGYTEKFRPENVGFGLTYVLPVVTAILASEKGDLIIVENPEAHLHPAGQTAIAKLIAKAAESGVQIIAETHSDHFLNGIRVAVLKKIIKPENTSLYYFSKRLESVEYAIDVSHPFIDEKGRIDEWPEGFFDEWDINLDMLLEE